VYNAQGIDIHSMSDFHGMHVAKLKEKKAKHIRQDTKPFYILINVCYNLYLILSTTVYLFIFLFVILLLLSFSFLHFFLGFSVNFYNLLQEGRG
jgi:hypothetical protein